jgi:hypothetical protein
MVPFCGIIDGHWAPQIVAWCREQNTALLAAKVPENSEQFDPLLAVCDDNSQAGKPFLKMEAKNRKAAMGISTFANAVRKMTQGELPMLIFVCVVSFSKSLYKALPLDVAKGYYSWTILTNRPLTVPAPRLLQLCAELKRILYFSLWMDLITEYSNIAIAPIDLMLSQCMSYSYGKEYINCELRKKNFYRLLKFSCTVQECIYSMSSTIP